MRMKNYLLATALGAIGGGVVVAIATKAIPKMMSQMMAGMMQNMMRQMGEGGWNPAEMWKRIMTSFGEAQGKEWPFTYETVGGAFQAFGGRYRKTVERGMGRASVNGKTGTQLKRNKYEEQKQEESTRTNG